MVILANSHDSFQFLLFIRSIKHVLQQPLTPNRQFLRQSIIDIWLSGL